MGKLLDKWNKNKFNVYESEEKTVLKIIENIDTFNKEIIEEVENKVPQGGNFTGSWQGISFPTLSEEGMRGVVEKLDKDIKNLITTEEINTIYVNADIGLDTNEGLTPNTPVRTLVKAFNILTDLGSKTLFKQWRIKIASGIYGGVRVQSLPLFTKPLLIEGSGWDNTIIAKQNDEMCGIWIEPCKGVQVTVSNLQVKNFKVGFNGYGILMKNQGYLLIQDCKVINCDCGFAGVNNVTLTVQRSIMENCEYGARQQYLGSATLGAGTGGKHMSDGGNGCEIKNCTIGFLTTRNSVSHTDYVKYINCGTAVKVEMNSRVATLGNVFDNCQIGIEANGGGEVILGTNDEVDTWVNLGNNIPYDFVGFTRYARLQSLYSKAESSFFTKLESEIGNNNLTGTTISTEIFRSSPSAEAIPNFYLMRNRVKVKVKLRGVYQLPEGQTIKISPSLIGLNDDNTTNGKNIAFSEVTINTTSAGLNGFEIDFELFFNKTEYQRYYKSLISNTTVGNRITTLPFTVTNNTNREGKKQLRINATLSDVTSVLQVKYLEMVISN